jgi:hypothetical protein
MKSILAAVPILLVAACGPRVEQVPIAQVVPPPPMEQRIVVPPPSPLYAPPPGPEARPRVHRSHRVRRTHEMLVRTQLSRCLPDAGRGRAQQDGSRSLRRRQGERPELRVSPLKGLLGGL